MKKPVHEDKSIVIPPIKKAVLKVQIKGTSPLISNRFPDKVKETIGSKQAGKAQGPRKPKDTEEEFRESLYELPSGVYGIPCKCFKAAMVAACRHLEGLTMVTSKGKFFVMGEYTTIEGSKPAPFLYTAKNSNGGVDLRTRARFETWRCTLDILFDADGISSEQIVNLLNRAGFHCGVMEGRPNLPKGCGTFGMFEVSVK